MPKIYFIDVTNRDAVQASRIIMAKLQKTLVNLYLGEMGIHQSEFCFPFVRHERNYLEGTGAKEPRRCRLAGLGGLVSRRRLRCGLLPPHRRSGPQYLNLNLGPDDPP